MDFGYELLEVGARRVWIHDGEEMIAEEESIRLCREDPEEWQREQEEQWESEMEAQFGPRPKR